MGKNREIVDKIKAEIVDDPAGVGYKNPDGSTKPLAEVFALGVAEGQLTDDESKLTDRDFLAAFGFVNVAPLMAKFTKYASAHEGFAICDRAMRDYSDGGGVNFSDPQVVAAINHLSNSANMAALGLEESDALTGPQKNAIIALGKRATSRFAEIGVPLNRPHYTRMALEEING